MGKVTIVVESNTIPDYELYKACQRATDGENFNFELPEDAEVSVVMPSIEELSRK